MLSHVYRTNDCCKDFNAILHIARPAVGHLPGCELGGWEIPPDSSVKISHTCVLSRCPASVCVPMPALGRIFSPSLSDTFFSLPSLCLCPFRSSLFYPVRNVGNTTRVSFIIPTDLGPSLTVISQSFPARPLSFFLHFNSADVATLHCATLLGGHNFSSFSTLRAKLGTAHTDWGVG